MYFDHSGYSSKKTIFRDVKKIDKIINMFDIYIYMIFKNHDEQKKRLRGYNLLVVPETYYEFQIDLMSCTDLENQKFEVGTVCINIFSNYTVVVPIKAKYEGDVAAGILESMNKMGKPPKIIYTDNEGALNPKSLQ